MALFLIVLATLSAMTFAIEAAGSELLAEKTHGEINRWGDIAGNLRLYLLMLAISWISGGFAEEMFFRGFLITRLQSVLAGARFATALAVVLPATLFGYVHVYYQGLQGFVNASIVGLIFGTAFLLYKRNLWPLVLAHGFINSLGFTAEFMSWDI